MNASYRSHGTERKDDIRRAELLANLAGLDQQIAEHRERMAFAEFRGWPTEANDALLTNLLQARLLYVGGLRLLDLRAAGGDGS
jgi:hypothetical protein